MSERTKKLKTKVGWLTAISIALLFGPLAYYLIVAAATTLAAGTTVATVAKVSIFSSSLIIFGVLTIIAAARKAVFKSSIWVLVVAIYVLLDNVMWAVLIIGSCQIVDELIVSPLRAHYKQQLTINKEIDKRLIPKED